MNPACPPFEGPLGRCAFISRSVRIGAFKWCGPPAVYSHRKSRSGRRRRAIRCQLALALTRAPVCVEAFDRRTRVCVRSATVINHLQTAVVQCVSHHQNLVAWERAIVATHVVSRALCRGLNVRNRSGFVIQDCSFDRWCSPRDLPEISKISSYARSV